VKLDVLPSRTSNPWIAAGSGVERHDAELAAVVPASSSPDAPIMLHRSEIDMRGVEPLRLMTGIDFRSARVLGVGLHAALSFGRYTDVAAASDQPSTVRPTGNLAEGAGAWHRWFTLGVHGVLFP
jgi:hypothetical protein